MTRPTPAQIPFCRLIVMIRPLERETAGFASGFTQSRGGHWEWPPSRIYFSIRASQCTVNHYQAALVSPRQASPTNGWPGRVSSSFGPDRPIPIVGLVPCRLHQSSRRGGHGHGARAPAQWPGPRSGGLTTSVPSCWLSRCQGQQLSPGLREAAASRRAGRRARPKARPRRLLPPPRPTTRPRMRRRRPRSRRTPRGDGPATV
jgi:hypothetical protein